MDFQATLQHLLALRPLSETQAEQAFEDILSGQVDDARIGAFLSLIAARPGGPTVDEVVGGARVFRRHAAPVPRPTTGRFASARLLDTCGTGGAPKLFNVSTAAALVIPSASNGRVMVAKHGNISRTGRGSVEVLRGLGVDVQAGGEVQTCCLGEIGICFSLAPQHHPAARHASAARKSLGFSTIFNLLGPLANPAGAECQIIGTWSHTNARLLAEALVRLDPRARAWVYSSRDGLDELTTTDRNVVNDVSPATPQVRLFDFSAADVGLSPVPVASLQCDSIDDAVDTVREVLDGRAGPKRDMVLLSAAAALVVCGCADDLRSGIVAAAEAVDSGRAKRTLDDLVRLSNSAA